MAYTEVNAVSHHIDSHRQAALMIESDTECLGKILDTVLLPLKSLLDAENVGSQDQSLVDRVGTLVLLWKASAALYEEAKASV